MARTMRAKGEGIKFRRLLDKKILHWSPFCRDDLVCKHEDDHNEESALCTCLVCFPWPTRRNEICCVSSALEWINHRSSFVQLTGLEHDGDDNSGILEDKDLWQERRFDV